MVLLQSTDVNRIQLRNNKLCLKQTTLIPKVTSILSDKVRVAWTSYRPKQIAFVIACFWCFNASACRVGCTIFPTNDSCTRRSTMTFGCSRGVDKSGHGLPADLWDTLHIKSWATSSGKALQAPDNFHYLKLVIGSVSQRTPILRVLFKCNTFLSFLRMRVQVIYSLISSFCQGELYWSFGCFLAGISPGHGDQFFIPLILSVPNFIFNRMDSLWEKRSSPPRKTPLFTCIIIPCSR